MLYYVVSLDGVVNWPCSDLLYHMIFECAT